MKEVYLKIWEIAKPYYEKGRYMDLAHLEWMIGQAENVSRNEKLDDSLLIPLVILHDVGYSEIKSGDCFRIESRKKHMAEGSKIAKLILEKLGCDLEKTERIVNWVSVHDNWALGDNSVYKNDLILAVLTDLDYIWMATPVGFLETMKLLHKKPGEMLDFLANNEKIKNRPFATKTTREIYQNYIGDRIREFSYLG